MESERNKLEKLENEFRVIPLKAPQREQKQWYEKPVLMKVLCFFAEYITPFYSPASPVKKP